PHHVPDTATTQTYTLSLHDALPILAQRKGGTIISPRPTYDNLVIFAEHLGADVRWIPLNDDMQTDLEAMSAAINSDTGMVYLCKDRKSTRLNSSHVKISYAVFCLKK